MLVSLSRTPSRRGWSFLFSLLAMTFATSWTHAQSASVPPAAPDDTPPPESTAAPAERSATTESSRERGRVMLKRNPIATEYQRPGSLGLAPGIDQDTEGVDFRSYFPSQRLAGSDPFSAQLSTTLNFNSLSERVEPGAGARIGVSGDSWGLAVQANTSAANRFIEHYEARWQQLTTDGPYFLDRPRFSQDEIYTRNSTFAIQTEFAPLPNWHFFWNGYYQHYDDHFFRNRLEYQFGSGTFSPTTTEGTTITEGSATGMQTRRYFGNTDTTRDRYRTTFGTEVEFTNDSRLAVSAYYHRWDIQVDRYDWNFNDPNLTASYSISDPYFPVVTATDAGGTFDPHDTSTAAFNSLRIFENPTEDEDFALRIDYDLPLTIGDLETDWALGALWRYKKRTESDEREVYLPGGPSFSLADVAYSDGPGRIVEDTYEQPPALSDGQARAFFDANRSTLFSFNEDLSDTARAEQAYTAEEEVLGLYALGGSRFFDSLDVEAGVRYEFTKTDTLGNIVERTSGAPVVTPVAATNDYGNLMFNALVEYHWNENWSIRGAYYQLLMRPQYVDIVNFRRVFVPTGTISEGNPNLEPATIQNYRLALVHESEPFGEFAFEIYYLAIEDFFYDATLDAFEDIDPASPGLESVTISRVENGDEGTVYGFRTEYARTFAWIPDSLESDLTISYAFSESESTIGTRPGENLWVPERSQHLGQASLRSGGEHWGVGLLINYQSRSLDEVGASIGEDEYREEVFSFGVETFLEVFEGLRLTADFFNLTNHPERAYTGTEDRVIRNQYEDWYANFGAEYTF